MISLYKLEKLPRSLRLRKVIKILGDTEYRLSVGVDMPQADFLYLKDALALLVKNGELPVELVHGVIASHIISKEVIRPVNAVRHFLLAEIGSAPADWDFIDGSGELDGEKRLAFSGMRVYLEDIRAPFNVGAMFRTAESFGAEKIYLSPFCADPHHPRSERTARGCVSVLPWERLSSNSIEKSSNNIEKLEYPVFALESGGTKLAEFDFPDKGIMIVGSEELGVSPESLAVADASLGRVSIPIYGAKGSLNASVAFGIAMQAWAEKLVNRYGLSF